MSSIQDLINSSRNQVDDESPGAQFLKKQAEMKVNAIEAETEQLAILSGLPYVNLFGFPISQEALILIDREICREQKVVCFFYDGSRIRVGALNPKNEVIVKIANDLIKNYHCDALIYTISPHSLKYALDVYSKVPIKREIIHGVEITPDELEALKNDIKDYKSLDAKIKEANISQILTLILATAFKTKASDIHIEAEEIGVAVRLRIDGVLQEAALIDRKLWPKIISRLKLLARVKINIFNKPQDGRFDLILKDGKTSIRCSFLPTAFGESVVMRLLRQDAISLSFEDLGLSLRGFEILGREINKPNGLILTTGPTGSGKTTTLYAVLKKLNQPGVKIVTLEDPIEYQLKGINQSQVDTSKGYTFANGLRSILRQDPNVILIGEIRDGETAEIAVQSSLTGHLVLSTLHTNDASGVIPRIIEMGIKTYLLPPSLNAVIGQRLLRKLCPQCRQEYKLEGNEEEKVRKILAVISPKANVNIPSELPFFYKAGPGCEHCSGIGYKGRIGIYEILEMTAPIKELTSQVAPSFKILHQAIEDGMVTMLQDGILKCLHGTTSTEEVYRVIGKTEYIDDLYDLVMSKTIGRGVKISIEEERKADEIARDLTVSQKIFETVSSGNLLGLVMALSVKSRAGDLHIEPTEKGVRIRFRVDGILHDIALIPSDYYLPLLSNIKILAGFPTNIKKATWDGRFNIRFSDNSKTDCRLSIISGGYGETIVVRLLSSQATSLKMDELGIRGGTLKIINNALKSTKGIILTTGPTGSGKTTTLYGLLNQINSPDLKIITIEDPIEYNLEGVMQTQIDVEGGYTFAAAMRSLLRQNPNVVMVGEIRDSETAKIAIEAAMTGHLVLSTIHTNSAAGSISRFVGLGVEKQMLANALNCAIGQRLARKICPFCRQEKIIDNATLETVRKIISQISPLAGVTIPQELKFYHGIGCEKCSGIGYKGRVGLYEAIGVSFELQKIMQKEDLVESDIEQEAIKTGALTLIQDGVLKALAGETTIEEVFRVSL